MLCCPATQVPKGRGPSFRGRACNLYQLHSTEALCGIVLSQRKAPSQLTCLRLGGPMPSMQRHTQSATTSCPRTTSARPRRTLTRSSRLRSR